MQGDDAAEDLFREVVCADADGCDDSVDVIDVKCNVALGRHGFDRSRAY